jgi:hypothetical protein
MAVAVAVSVVHTALSSAGDGGVGGLLARIAGHGRRFRADDVQMHPTGGGAPGAAFLQTGINWLGQYGLWFALAAMIIGGAVYGVSTYGGNSYQGSRGRTVALAGAAGAIVIGLAPTVVNLLFHAANGG